jgi:lactoylglutathione lyase
MDMNAPMEIGICVADLGKMMAFYEQLLGMRKISEIPLNEHGARMSGLGEHGYTVVRLQTPYGERIKLVCPSPTPPGESWATPTARRGVGYLTFLVSGLDALLTKLAAAGFPSIKGAVELRPGVRMSLVKDPEGNWVEFAEYVDIHAYRPDLKKA